jgi:uncharacterized protein YndB with AHSA1/START domain
MGIHQEAVIAAPPQQVFELLTNGSLFSAATGQPAETTDHEGDSFSLFGGRVEGCQIKLVPGQRVVHAWRFSTTAPIALGARHLRHGSRHARNSQRKRRLRVTHGALVGLPLLAKRGDRAAVDAILSAPCGDSGS